VEQAVEKHKRKPEALRGWCIYWLVMGLYTVGVQISDRFVFWVPMYCEAKVGFVLYLWHPKTQGALYIYESFVAPFLARHEPDIDRHIDETQTSVGDVVVKHSQATGNFVREKFAQMLAALPQAVPQQPGAQGSG
jgi:receptor expression-enhancing protein 1/2/3/4